MDDALGWVFASLAVVFSVWIVLTLGRYLRYRRLAPSSLLSWEVPRPWFFNLCLGIGFFMLVMTVFSLTVLDRPVLHGVAQALMAVFYIVVFPLGFRIRRGFYRSGIWSEGGFVPYGAIRWIGWKETPEIVLALRTEGPWGGYAFLRVPGRAYGQARRILADRIEDRSLSLETSVLGLDGGEAAQERV